MNVDCFQFTRPVFQRLVHDVADLRDLVNAHESVHFGHQFWQFVAEPLGQAAGNDDGLAAIGRVAQLNGFENGIHALLLRGVNKGAGVDDDGVGLRGVIGDLDAAFEERAEHDFGVHEIFGAAERNQADPQRFFAARSQENQTTQSGGEVENYLPAALVAGELDDDDKTTGAMAALVEAAGAGALVSAGNRSWVRITARSA